MKKFSKILIANRGEIAVRILRSCKELGIQTVSVHSEADEDSLHVKLADESVCIGPAKSSLSYLNIPSILSAAEITGADAIHPGYGFLAENEEFARMCAQWNVAFIGPKTACIESMGDKIESKRIAREAGVPTLEPALVNELDEEELLAKTKKLGLPVIIKASAGGGGRGMRKVDRLEDVLGAVAVLKKEALAGFGDDTLFIEKYIERPRHIEVQILADTHGNIIHLGERDCTIQRRFQKIIEESPSPVLSGEKREEICESAVRLAKHVGYDSAGTVEFLYDLDSENFYFMEMNTRIQVEHPVTEERCHIDLIKEQILHAFGNKMRYRQDGINFYGHVMEFRVNAEDPRTSMPSPGVVTHYHRPGGLGIRVDDYIYTGYRVPPYYDSMISKIVVSGVTREECLIRAKRALDETVVGGIKTNIELHQRILEDRDFRQNTYDTGFLSKKC